MRLTSVLTETFLAARWEATGGQPVCPRCFDGEDVRPGYRCQHRRAELPLFFCACCKYPFGPATGTPLEHTSRPLALWAWLALGGQHRDLLPPGKAHQWKREYVRQMRRRLAESPVCARWATLLAARGITPARLAEGLTRDTAWWGTPPRGQKPRASRQGAA